MDTTDHLLVVGAGTMGANYVRLVTSGRLPGVTVAGVVDLDGSRASRLAAEAGAPAFSALTEALASTTPTAAYVATPDASHREPVEVLARAGVPVLVEKPLATTVEDARAMVEAVAHAGIHAEVNYSNRWNPPFVEARRAIQAGEIGTVRSFNVCLNNRITSPRDNLSWSAGTTPAWFLMSHCLDLAYWLGGRSAERVYATGGRGHLDSLGIRTWDWIHALVSFEGGGDGVFESSWVLPESWPAGIEFRFRVTGTAGAIDVNNTLQNIAVASSAYRYPATLSWAPQRVRDFLLAARGLRPGGVMPAEALEATRVLVAIHRSLETGRAERP